MAHIAISLASTYLANDLSKYSVCNIGAEKSANNIS